MHKQPEHVQAAIEECRKFNATIDIEVCRNKIKGYIHYNGKTRLLSLSKTPSDWRVPMKVRSNVRHIIAEMNNGAS